MKALVDPLKHQVKDRGLWALLLDEDLGGPGYGQVKLALLNEVLKAHGSAPVIFGASFGETADILFVMCSNGIFLVEQGTPGIEWLHGAGDHSYVRYTNVRVPLDHLLGPRVVGAHWPSAGSAVAGSTTPCAPSPPAERRST